MGKDQEENQVQDVEIKEPSLPESGEVDEQPVVNEKAEKVEKENPVSGEIATKEATGNISDYTPNYKYRVLDKELEFDERIRGAIKSKEQEDLLRDLYTKAYGLDEIKPKYASALEYKNKYETTQKNIQKIEKYLVDEDVENFFGALGWSPEKTQQTLAKYIKSVLDQQEMPEDQRMQLAQHKQDKLKAQQYEEMVNQERSSKQELETRILGMELDMTLNSPDFSEFAKFYDERRGKPGSFKERVILEGHRRSLETGRTASPREVVAEIVGEMKALGSFPTPNQAPNQQFQAKPKPTIPNVQTRGGSPAQKNFNSFDDIEKYVAEQWGS